MEQILTAEEVAVYLRVHLMTVRRWCRTGDLPSAKIGRAYRIKKGDLDEWWARKVARGERSEGGPNRPEGTRDA